MEPKHCGVGRRPLCCPYGWRVIRAILDIFCEGFSFSEFALGLEPEL
jgi:hypothetical protein